MRFGIRNGCHWLVQEIDVQNHFHFYFKYTLWQIAGKQAGYRAMAEFYQSLVCKSNKSIGEEIARLEVIAAAFKLFTLNS